MTDPSARSSPDRIQDRDLTLSAPGEGPDRPDRVTPPGPEQSLPCVPGYEVLEELGRGGRGIVYKAHHLALKRTVALKMILGGASAAESERRRFRTEAEAVARLSHPNIVQLYEAGEHEGRPFCALEFVEGGNLGQRLAGRPQPPRQAALWVERLAEAMHLAHSRNIVHRDLKPANVLLTADGEPKITDFGLARDLDAETSQTQSGVIVGTPSYMAPEQASAQRVGPAADVYALGAILYELLTGRPPFLAATLMQTLEQVRSGEPAKVRALNPIVPRDLETICLKCLRKEPERRYSSAHELAEDLARFRRGEPVAARPVGAAERMGKWVRRNPAVTALTTLVLIVMAGAAGLSLSFWSQAQATRVRQAEESERRAHEALTDARADLRADPLGPHDGPLNDAELSALWDLSQDDEPVRRRFLERMLERPSSAARLARRAAWSVQAVVGLNSERRDWMLDLLRQKFHDEKADPAVRRTCVNLLWALRWPDDSLRRDAGSCLVEEMRRTDDPATLRRDALTLVALEQITPAGETGDFLEATRAVLDLTSRTGMGPPIYDAATRSGSSDLSALSSLEGTLDVLVGRLKPEQVREAARHALTLMARTKDRPAMTFLSRMLVRLARPLPAGQAGELTSGVADLMARTDNAALLEPLAGALAGLAALSPTAAERLVGPAQHLLALMQQDDSPASLGFLAPGLAQLLPRLSPAQSAALAERATGLLLDVLTRTSNPFLLGSFGGTLAAYLNHLGPAAAAAAAQRAVQLLVDALTRPIPGLTRTSLGNGLTLLAPRLPPEQVAALVRRLLDMMAGVTDMETAVLLSGPVTVLAGRLTPPQATQAAQAALEAMGRTSNLLALPPLASAAAALAGRMPPKKAQELSHKLVLRLTEAMARPENSFTLAGLAPAVSALAPRLAPTAAREAAGALLAGLGRATDANAVHSFAQALADLAVRLTPADAAEVAEAVLAALPRSHYASGFGHLGIAAAALVDRLPPPQAAELSNRVLRLLLGTASHSGEASTPGYLGMALARLARHISPGGAAQALRAVLPFLTRASDTFTLHALTSAVSALVGRLSDESLEELATPTMQALLGAMSRTAEPVVLSVLREALTAVAQRLPAHQLSVTLPLVCAALKGVRGPAPLLHLAQPLTVLAGRLEEGQATSLAAGISATLLDAATRTNSADVLRAVAPALTRLAEQIQTQELIGLLKRPTCVGDARDTLRAVLNKRLGQSFANHWELVDWLRQNRPDLDLDSPPPRAVLPFLR